MSTKLSDHEKQIFKEYSEYLDGKSPVVTQLLLQVLLFLDEITDNNYKIEKKKTSLHVVNNKAFLGIHFLTDKLRLNIVLKQPINTTFNHKIDKPSAHVYHNKVDLHTLDDFNKIKEHIIQAYELTICDK